MKLARGVSSPFAQERSAYPAPDRLFIKGVNWIGDAVMTTPALDHLRHSFPKTHIVLMARPSVAPVYEHHPALDEVWVEDESKSPGQFMKAVARIRRGKFDAGVCFPNSFRTGLLMHLGGVGKRYGFKRHGRGWLLNRGVPYPDSLNGIHQVHHYLYIIEELCGKLQEKPLLHVEPGEIERGDIERLLLQHGLPGGRPLIGIAPGSVNSNAKRWPAQYYAELIEELDQICDGAYILLGGPGERDVIEEVSRKTHAQTYHFGSEVNLSQAVALFSRLDAFVGNDAGGMHLAAAFNIPMAAVFGPTRSDETSPFSSLARVVREPVECAPCMLRECPLTGESHHQCMHKVSVKRVIRELREVVTKAGREDIWQ